MNKDRRRVGAEWCLTPRSIGRCCVKEIERMEKEEGRELVKRHLGCGCRGMCVLHGKRRERGELEGELGRVVRMMREGKNLVTEVTKSIAKLAQYYEWGTSRHVHSRKILMMQQLAHGLGM